MIEMNFLKSRPLALLCTVFAVIIALCSIFHGSFLYFVALATAVCGIIFLLFYIFRHYRKGLFVFLTCMFCTAGLIIGNTYYDNREKTKTAYIEKSAEVTAVLHDCLYSGTAYSAYNAEITAFDKAWAFPPKKAEIAEKITIPAQI